MYVFITIKSKPLCSSGFPLLAVGQFLEMLKMQNLYCQTPVPSPDFSLGTRSWLCFTPVTTRRNKNPHQNFNWSLILKTKSCCFTFWVHLRLEKWSFYPLQKTPSCLFWIQNILWVINCWPDINKRIWGKLQKFALDLKLGISVEFFG